MTSKQDLVQYANELISKSLDILKSDTNNIDEEQDIENYANKYNNGDAPNFHIVDLIKRHGGNLINHPKDPHQAHIYDPKGIYNKIANKVEESPIASNYFHWSAEGRDGLQGSVKGIKKENFGKFNEN